MRHKRNMIAAPSAPSGVQQRKPADGAEADRRVDEVAPGTNATIQRADFFYDFSSWPRTSPAGFALVCRLT